MKNWVLNFSSLSFVIRVEVFHSHEWLRQIFSLVYQYNIKRRKSEYIENLYQGIVGWSNTKSPN